MNIGVAGFLCIIMLGVLALAIVGIDVHDWYDINYPVRRVHGCNMADLKSMVSGKTMTIDGKRFRVVRWISLTLCEVRPKLLPGRWWL